MKKQIMVRIPEQKIETLKAMGRMLKTPVTKIIEKLIDSWITEELKKREP